MGGLRNRLIPLVSRSSSGVIPARLVSLAFGSAIGVNPEKLLPHRLQCIAVGIPSHALKCSSRSRLVARHPRPHPFEATDFLIGQKPRRTTRAPRASCPPLPKTVPNPSKKGRRGGLPERAHVSKPARTPPQQNQVILPHATKKTQRTGNAGSILQFCNIPTSW